MTFNVEILISRYFSKEAYFLLCSDGEGEMARYLSPKISLTNGHYFISVLIIFVTILTLLTMVLLPLNVLLVVRTLTSWTTQHTSENYPLTINGQWTTTDNNDNNENESILLQQILFCSFLSIFFPLLPSSILYHISYYVIIYIYIYIMLIHIKLYSIDIVFKNYSRYCQDHWTY